MDERQILHHFYYLTLKNIVIEHPDHFNIENYSDYNEQNVETLYGIFWDTENNTINKIVYQQLDLKNFNQFLKTYGKNKYTSFDQLENDFTHEKQYFIKTNENKRTAGRRKRSYSFYQKPEQIQIKNEDEALHLYIKKMKLLKKNPEDRGLITYIQQLSEQYPITVLLRNYLIEQVEDWITMSPGTKNQEAFNEIEQLLELYLLSPGAEISDIDNKSLNTWKQEYRLLLSDWLVLNRQPKNQRRALYQFNNKMIFALKVGAATSFNDWEFLIVQNFYMSAMKLLSKSNEREACLFIKLMQGFTQFSLVQQLLRLRDNITGLNEENAQSVIDYTLFFDENSLDAKLEVLINELLDFDKALSNKSAKTEQTLTRAMETFELDLPVFANFIFSAKKDPIYQLALESITDFVKSFEQEEYNENSSAASSSAASSSTKRL